MSAVLTPARRIGRFELQRVLGRGAQATVWLAHDPRLDRDVALKLLDPTADAQSLSEWLNEARAVSRLAHPNVVPVFEADEYEQPGGAPQPYLVFEFVEGPTLQQARRQRPAWPAKEAAELMLGVLDALAAAHAQGIVHRDLKPSNVLLGSDGRPRVMDFGIAARISDKTLTGGGAAPGAGLGSSLGAIVGTPGYMSPEAARGDAPVPAMDVFSAGVMLAELLSGVPLLRETDPMRAVQRVQEEDLKLPDSVRVDDVLRGIVQRALARDVRARYDGARSMHAALSAWLHPNAETPPETALAHGTLEFLLRRMRHKTDFPAMSDSVVRIQRVATSDTESLASLSSEILKDVALTKKLLRMVNTVHFSQAAGGGVATVSRAVALVGFAGIRNMALSVVLMEHMGDKAHAAVLKEEFLRALMAGTLASELTPLAREGEDAFLGSMFQNLGRLLTEYYFPEEALQVRQQLRAGAHDGAAREAAARRVLGLGYDDLGQGVARAWGLPDNLQRAMRPPEGDVPGRVLLPGVDRLRWLGRSANALTDALLTDDGAPQQLALLKAAVLYAPALGMTARDIVAKANDARGKLLFLTQAMNLHVARGSPARRLIEGTPNVPAPGVAELADGTVAVARPGTSAPVASALVASAPGTSALDMSAPPAAAAQAAATQASPGPALRDGLAQVRALAANGQPKLNDVLQSVLQTVHLALQCRTVVFCLRDPRSGLLTGRFGLGDDQAAVCAALRIDPAQASNGDMFAALCARGADTLIADATTGPLAQKLPSWYRSTVNAPTFLLLPLMHKSAPFGLIYADKAEAGSLKLDAPALGLVKALRDEVVQVFGRGSGG
jgi:serine/threonine protein kinase